MISVGRLAGHRIYLETYVFIYLVEGHATFKPPLAALFQLVKDKASTAATSELSLAEVLVKPLAGSDTHIVETYKRLLSNDANLRVLPVSREILVASAALRARFGGRAFDAIHAATAIELGCKYFVSEDAGIRLPEGVEHVRPSLMTAG